MNQIYNYFHNIEYLQENIIPSTVTGFVSLAALLYMKDISTAENPELEFKHLRKNTSNYVPKDEKMKFWFTKCQKIFDLKYNFNPIFPQVYYKKNILINIILDYGLIPDEDESEDELYKILLEVYQSGRYFQGLLPLCNTETIITCELLENINCNEIISFGEFGKVSEAFTYEELFESFTKNKNLLDPKSMRLLSERRVLSLLSCIYSSNSEFKLKLINLITKLLEKQRGKDNNTFKLLSSRIGDEKEELIFTLKKLMNCGMSMRGWVKGEEYPLLSTQTIVNNECDLMVNVNLNILEYKACNENSLKIINEIPLVYYRRGTFINVEDEVEGKTIGERINIIISETETNESSCIRLSSNFLIHSAYKYLLILNSDPGFDINSLSNIF